MFRPLVSYNMVWRSKVPRSQTGKLDGYRNRQEIDDRIFIEAEWCGTSLQSAMLSTVAYAFSLCVVGRGGWKWWGMITEVA